MVVHFMNVVDFTGIERVGHELNFHCVNGACVMWNELQNDFPTGKRRATNGLYAK